MIFPKCQISLDRSKQQLNPHGSIDFPCAGYIHLYTDRPDDIVPWHWHDELEIAYVKSGTIKMQILAKTYELHEGDGIIINSNISHYAAASPRCQLESLLFSPLLITGNDQSVFAAKYIQPLILCNSFKGYQLSHTKNEEIIRNYTDAFHALANEVSGYEFIVRSELTKICVYLFQQFEHQIETGKREMNPDELRLKKMLDFIHSNFANNLTLNQIAQAADIGERECLRCFQRTIHLSPIQYLLKYRLMWSADLLMNQPSTSISEIAALCGFESPSNFAKVFKRFYNRTPREYRRFDLG